MVHRQVPRRAVQERAAGTGRKRIPMLDEAQEGLLHEIGRQIAVMQPSVDIIGQFPAMAQKEPADPSHVHEICRPTSMTLPAS